MDTCSEAVAVLIVGFLELYIFRASEGSVGDVPGRRSFRFVGWTMNENVLWWLLSFSETAVGLLLFCWLEPSPAED